MASECLQDIKRTNICIMGVQKKRQNKRKKKKRKEIMTENFPTVMKSIH